jgi:hypothetical protein
MDFKKIFSLARIFKTKFKKLTPKEISIIVFCVIIVIFLFSKTIEFLREGDIASEKQIIAGVKVGLNRYYIESSTKNNMSLRPQTLDGAELGYASEKNPFFTNVLAFPGVTFSKWRKLLPNVYQGPSLSFYFYDPVSGDFVEQKLLPKKIVRLLNITEDKISADFVMQLKTRPVINFVDGKQLIGGAVVLTPGIRRDPVLTGEESETELFSGFKQELEAEIAAEFSSIANQIKFGYYKIEQATNKKIICQIFEGLDSVGIRKSFSVDPKDEIGFYFSITNEPKDTFFTQSSDNPDKSKHIRVFRNETLRKITFVFEQAPLGRDKDYNDMFVTVSY